MATTTKGSRSGFIAIAIGTILGVLSIALPSLNSFWSIFGVVSQQERVGESTALAILFICLGFLLAVYLQQLDFKSDVLKLQDEKLERLISAIPSIHIYSRYSGDEAMVFIASLLPITKMALNTRILTEEMNKTNHPVLSPWDNAVRSAVKNGLTFRDVVSKGNESIANGRSQAAIGGSGIYEASFVEHSLPSFMNFIVLEGRDGSLEVWFGWIVSKSAGYEGTVIRTGDAHIVQLFERWHREMFNAGTMISAGLPSPG